MANTFYRKPNPGGDDGAWAPYNDAMNDASLGILTCRLYNDGGALKISKGRIGINNGTARGICHVDTITTISLAGVSNSTWASIEMTVSGTAVTFTAADIAGATDPAELPAGFKNSYDGEKGGFYINATGRTVGLIFLNSSGVLLAVINTVGDREEWWASQIGLHTGTIHTQQGPGKGFVIEIGDWNMDSTANIDISHYFGVFKKGAHEIDILIRPDTTASAPIDPDWYMPLALATDPDSGFYAVDSSVITLLREAGGIFDNAHFDATSYNRGWITVHMRDF